MQNLLKNKILLTIFFLGFFLRIYKLAEIPSGFYVDESAIGYNAYSFLITGADEYGKYFPIFLRSFGVYASPLYAYATIPFVKLFGVSVFSTRLLSALSGTFSILAIYFLVKEMFKNKKIALISSFVFSLSPWSIFFSRGAYEANFALLILIVAIYTLYKQWFLLASVLLALNTYAYQAQRLNSLFLITIFGLFYLLDNKKNIKKAIFSKKIIWSVLVFTIILLPQLFIIRSPAFATRASGLFYVDAITGGSENSNFALSFLREFFSQYSNYFSLNNIFYLGDKDLQRSLPNLGPMYTFLVLPFLLGLYELFSKIKSREHKVILLLFLIFPITPALTKDPFSTLRNLSSLVPITIIISLGIFKVKNLLSNTKFVLLVVLFTLVSFLFLWRSYFVLFPYERQKTWSGGYSQLAQIIEENPNKTFVVENSRLKPPYILLAFFLKLDPNLMQQSVDEKIRDNYYENNEWNPVYKIANFETRNIDWEKDVYKNLILVGDSISISDQQAVEHFLEKKFEIRTVNKEIVFLGYETNPEKKCASIENKNVGCKQ